MEFYKNDLVSVVLENYYNLYMQTLDTPDFVPPFAVKKINKTIYKDMKRSFKQAEREYKKFKRAEFWRNFKFGNSRLKAVEQKLDYVLSVLCPKDKQVKDGINED